MCISDYILGRMIRHFSTAWNTTGAFNTTFNRNNSRVGLIVSRTTTVLAATSGTVLTFGDGAVIDRPGGSAPPLILLLKEHGDIVQQDFIITAIGTAHTGVVTELLLPPELIDSELEFLKRIRLR